MSHVDHRVHLCCVQSVPAVPSGALGQAHPCNYQQLTHLCVHTRTRRDEAHRRARRQSSLDAQLDATLRHGGWEEGAGGRGGTPAASGADAQGEPQSLEQRLQGLRARVRLLRRQRGERRARQEGHAAGDGSGSGRWMGTSDREMQEVRVGRVHACVGSRATPSLPKGREV